MLWHSTGLLRLLASSLHLPLGTGVRSVLLLFVQASVRALEQLFEELRQRTAQELAVLPKVGQSQHSQQWQHIQLDQKFCRRGGKGSICVNSVIQLQPMC